MKISDRVQRLKAQLQKQAGTKKTVRIDSIKSGELKSLAKDVAGGRTITISAAACLTDYRPNETVSKSRLEAAIAKVATEARKADADKDGALKKSEQLKLSGRAADALGYQFSKEDAVVTGC